MQHDSDDHRIESEDQLAGIVGEKHPLAVNKCLTHLDRYAREFIARSPFVCIATQGADGRADVSPRGDPPGFATVLDDATLALPDRPGNNRVDTRATSWRTRPSASCSWCRAMTTRCGSTARRI